MGTEGGSLIYSPGVSIIIESAQAGMVDVSQDCSSGSLTFRENGSHNLQITIENPNRKYDGLFCPNDRIVVQMKRTRWLQVFSGYIDSAPYFSTYARPVDITAQCALKVFKNWPWDRGSVKAAELLNRGRASTDVRSAQDGGMAQIVSNLITEITNWPAEKVHIGRVPEDWYAKFQRVYERLDDAITTNYDPVIGINPIIAGKAVGGFSGGGPSISTGTIGSFTPTSDDQLAQIVSVDADVDVVLQTIRTLESGGNYSAINKGDGKGDWATGAYQYTDGTWNNYKGYKRAYEAPPAVQDERAGGDVRNILSKYGNKTMNVPCGWYYPASLRDPTWLDKIPAAGEGNTMTIRQYAYKWLRKYVEIFTSVRGGPPPSYSDAAGGSTAQPTSAGVIYPIPAGVTRLTAANDGWGGFQNGSIPSSAMQFTKRTGSGHPVAIQAFTALLAAADAAGFDMSGGCYRSREAQAQVGAMGAPPGKSVHGWGLALDISVLVPNNSITKKYPGYNNTQMYSTPEYQWMKANAYKYGWGHPDWGQQGGSKPEAWHWEFFAFRGLTPGQSQVQGINPFDSAAAGPGMQGGMGTPSALSLFSALNNWMHPVAEDAGIDSELLFGYKALMNDEPVMVAIDQFTKAAGRSYCTAPNGDFMAWWPDYWGEYGLAGIVEVESIELKDFTVNYSDENLITHQFVEGAFFPDVNNPMPMGIMSSLSAIQTRGVAAVDMPNFLSAIINVKDSSQYPWLVDPGALLQRFGARVSRARNTAIIGPHQEFFDAVQRFTRAWASQFSARAPMTFMPELYPGMLLRLPLFKVQMYVQSVTHSWSYAGGEGFTTTANTMAVSATSGSGFFMFPKGGDLRPIGTGRGRGLYS